MGDDVVQAAPRRSGCLKWTCGCLALAAALPLFAACVCLYALSGWEPAGGAWERLPPDAVFAFEANDVAGLLKAAGGDPGAVSLAAALVRRYQRFLEENNIPVEPDLAQTVYDWSGILSRFHTIFFPNYILTGARSFDADGMFCIVQPPRWFAWTAGAGLEEGEIGEISDDEGSRVFIAFRGEFVIGGISRDVVRHVLDNWETRAAPLGGRAGPDGAYVMFAHRSGGGEAVPADAPFLSGGLANNFVAPPDPFAPPAAGSLAATRAGTRLQTLVLAGDGGWNVQFESVDAAMPVPPGSFADRMNEAFASEKLDAVLPDSSDVEAALRMPEEHVDMLARMADDEWLRYGWLERAGGTFTLLAARPVMEEADADTDADAPSFPPLPVVSLGWNLRSLHAPVPFANFLEESLEKLRASGPLPAETARALIHSNVAEDKRSGSLSVPGVLVNGAKPVWKFFLDAVPSMGWMASDPAGLPDEALLDRLAARDLPEPAAGRVAAVANWDMSRVFIDAAAEVAEDRLSQLPEEWFRRLPDGKRDAGQLIRAARTLFTIYPRGELRADIDVDARAATGRAFVLFGVGVEF